MNISNSLQSTLFSADRILSQFYLRLFQERNALIIFIFHGFILDFQKKNLTGVEPRRFITESKFQQFIEYFLESNYEFISPDEILTDLNRNKKFALITFDDGYFNNYASLSTLKTYRVPAVFFISTNHVIDNKSYWWDVLYRERTKQGVSLAKIRSESRVLKTKTHNEIEEHLIKEFGHSALTPLGDIDRPLSPLELKNFVKEKYVYLGNHTRDHAILTNYSQDGIRSQILGAQQALLEMTGIQPAIISYPDGKYSSDVIKASQEAGLQLGVTADYGKNRLPVKFSDSSKLFLKRCPLWETQDLKTSCSLVRSDISFYGIFKKLRTKGKLQ
jgi:peptidoglycan/xylan/chitin deacetylase (PgdA/CDA1 family)